MKSNPLDWDVTFLPHFLSGHLGRVENLRPEREEVYMEGLLYQIDLMSSTFTSAEGCVAQYVLKNPQAIKELTMQELAKQAHVSLSAITRFAQTLGYKGYREFLVDFTYQLAVSNQGVFVDTQEEKFSENIPLNLLNQNRVVLSETFRLLDSDKILEAGRMLFHAKKILCYGIGASELVARDFLLKLARVEKMAVLIPDIDFGKVLINQLDDQDVVFLVSYSGMKQEVLETARCAKSKGKQIISLTRYGQTKLSEMADIALHVVAYENDFRSSAITSRFAQLYIADILFYTMLQFYDDKGYRLLKGTYYIAHGKD